MNKEEAWRLMLVLFLGQLVSFSLALCNFISSYIVKLGLNIPLTQSFFSSTSLALVYCSILLLRRQKLQVPVYWYIPLAFVDLQGNYLLIKANQYSSITSITLLGCWSIPWVIILTYLALRTRYTQWQVFGAAVCMVGLVLVLLSDAKGTDTGPKNPLLGDTLVIIATLCFAISNVGEEYCVKKNDFIEVVAMLGVFEALIGALEITVFERREFLSVNWSFQLMSGSTLLNLSLLTCNMWAVAFRILVYNQKVDWLYYLAVIVVAIGLVLYSVSETCSSKPAFGEAAAAAVTYEALDNEEHEVKYDVS